LKKFKLFYLNALHSDFWSAHTLIIGTAATGSTKTQTDVNGRKRTQTDANGSQRKWKKSNGSEKNRTEVKKGSGSEIKKTGARRCKRILNGNF